MTLAACDSRPWPRHDRAANPRTDLIFDEQLGLLLAEEWVVAKTSEPPPGSNVYRSARALESPLEGRIRAPSMKDARSGYT